MNESLKNLVAHFGSQEEAAVALKVKQGTVSGWVRGIHGCSAEVAFRAERVTNGLFKAVDLRPSLLQAA